MSHRGRGGYSGSSYRGSSSRGTWSDSRSSRGGHSTSRGSSSYTSRGASFSSTRGSDRSVGGRYWSGSSGPSGSSSTFESRSRYASSPHESSRYSGSSRSHADDSFKRPYRADSSYGSRDIGHRSPERKRIRSEVQGDRSPRAISSRRSHEGGSYAEYSTNGSSSHRYEPSGGDRSSATASRYSGERRQFSSSERRPSSSGGFRPPAPPRDEYRKPSGPPPSPRGSYRGRLSSRGLTRRETAFGRRRVIESSSFLTRPRVTVRSSEYIRKLKLAKLRSAASRRIISSRKFRSRATVRRRSSEKKENWDDDEKDADKAADKKKSDEKSQSDNEKSSKKSPKVNGASPSGKDDADKEKDDESSDNEPRSRYTGRRFIRLTCVHCNEKCVTFSEYSAHLIRSRHLAAMRRVAILQKSVLSRMRVQQRSKQRELDKDDENSSSRKNFCLLCKLNYKQMKSVHQSSEAHKEMKKFLMPFCKTCRITFRSPMLYENHLCSLEHIKRKAQVDSDDKSRADGGGSGNEGELNLDNFLTLDSVGNVDDEEGNESDKKSKDDKDEENETEEKKPKKEPPVNVGQEHIRKIEVLYCDLCRTYITSAPHATSEEKRASAVKQHCRTRPHLKRYVRKTEDAALRETAERIHRSNQAKSEASHKEKAKDAKVKKEKDKDTEKEKDDNEDEKDTSKTSITDEDTTIKTKGDKTLNDDETGDEKMWADVDKDLGDLLAEVEPGSKSSDEDEEKGGGERYDRFRYSEKGIKEKLDSTVDSTKLDEDVKEEKVEAKEDDEDK